MIERDVMPKGKVKKTNEKHAALYRDLCDIVEKHELDLSHDEIIAIFANMVGRLIAVLDPDQYTAAELSKLISQNIELGNKDALTFVDTVGSA